MFRDICKTEHEEDGLHCETEALEREHNEARDQYEINFNDDYKRSCVSGVYAQQENYLIIGLTGRCGSGCSSTCEILCKPNEYDPKELLGSARTEDLCNDDRDREIILNFSKSNDILPFEVIKVRDILTTFVLECPNGFFDLIYAVLCAKGDDRNAIKEQFYVYMDKHLPFAFEDGADYDVTIYPDDAESHNANAGKENGAALIPDGEKSDDDLLPGDFQTLHPFDAATKYFSDIWKRVESDLYSFIRHISKKHYNFLFSMLGQISNTIRDFLIVNYDKNSYTSVYQHIGNTIRTYGSLDKEKINAGPGPDNIQLVAERIHIFIKILRRKKWILSNYERQTQSRPQVTRSNVHVVIDSIKNVFEANYLKSRYSSFYLVALTLDNKNRKRRLKINKGLDDSEINSIDIREQHDEVKRCISLNKKGLLSKNSREYHILFQPKDLYSQLFIKAHLEDTYMFNLQDVNGCIQNADILINNIGTKEELKLKIMRYICLMLHPGLVPPTNDEICMQIAQAAKLNSGCISRQVGAVVSDKQGNVLSVGWNDPSSTGSNECINCVRRSFNHLVRRDDDIAYSYYELYNPDFRKQIAEILKQNLERYISENKPGDQEKVEDNCACNTEDAGIMIDVFEEYASRLGKGLPLAFCFKDIYTSITNNNNQVHTRAQHGEERALEACAKGSASGGTLYTTSSSCELCAKKALSYDIRRIVYIEPYSGITNDHILGHSVPDGVKVKRDRVVRVEPMSIELFTGATQRAYAQLYTPVFPLKDELSLRGINLKGSTDKK